MAIDFGSGRSHYSLAEGAGGLSLPNSDWSMGMWVRLNRGIAGQSAYQYLISAGNTIGSPNSFHLFLGNSTDYRQIYLRCRDAVNGEYNSGSTGGSILDVGDANGVADYNQLLVVQRRGANIEMYLVPTGTEVTAPTTQVPFMTTYTTDVPVGALSLSNWWIGERNDGTADRWYANILSEFFLLTDGSLAPAQITTLASGTTNIETVWSTLPHAYYKFEADADIEPDLGGDHDATLTGGALTTTVAHPIQYGVEIEGGAGADAGAYADGDIDTDPATTTKVDISGLVIVGASIMERTFEEWDNVGTSDDFRLRLLQKGYDLPFKSYAVSGAVLSDLDANISGYTSKYTSPLYVMIHIGGNDNSNNGNWSFWTQAEKDAFSASLRSICQKVVDAGHHPILCPLTWRRYSWAVEDEDTGSKAANENLIYPLIQEFSPHWWDDATGLPVMDLYRVGKDNDSVYFGDSSDSIHPTPAGMHLLREYVVDRLIERANLPAKPEKKTFSFSMVTDATERAPMTNSIGLNSVLTGVRSIEGESLPGVTVTQSGFTNFSVGKSANSIPHLFTDSLHYVSTSTVVYRATGTPATNVFNFGPAFANLPVEVKITGARDGLAAGRRGLYTVNGVSGTLDATLVPPVQLVLLTQFDENGILTMSLTPDAGQSFVYFSAADLSIPTTGLALDGIDHGQYSADFDLSVVKTQFLMEATDHGQSTLDLTLTTQVQFPMEPAEYGDTPEGFELSSPQSSPRFLRTASGFYVQSRVGLMRPKTIYT